jgi:histidinol-phosphate aminotransferase
MRNSIQDLIPYDPGMTIEQLEQEVGKTIIKLSANESLWGPAPSVRNALQNSFAQLKFYPDGVAEELKKALCKLWALPAENFCLGNGADEIIQMLATAFLNPGDEVVIPTPTFSSYDFSVTVVGGKVTFVPQMELTFKLEEIAAYIHPGVKMVFLCNPNNPTGTFFSHTNLELFLQKVPPKTLVVLTEWAKNN